MLWSIDILRRELPKIKDEDVKNAKFNSDSDPKRINLYKAVIYALRLIFRTIDSKIKAGDAEPINIEKLIIGKRNVYLILLDSKIVNKPTNSKFKERKQEDASELLDPLLNIISSFEPFEPYNNAFKFVEESYIKCKGKEETKSKEDISNELFLTLGTGGNNIQGLINNYIQPEILESPENQLESCGEKGEKGTAENKRLNIKVFDDPSNKTSNLIITLKRFSLGAKITNRIVVNPIITIDSKQFAIKGCIIHIGKDMNAGHYVYAVYKNGNIQYVMNDATQEKENLDNYSRLIQNNGYVFLYQRVDSAADLDNSVSSVSGDNSIDTGDSNVDSNVDISMTSRRPFPDPITHPRVHFSPSLGSVTNNSDTNNESSNNDDDENNSDPNNDDENDDYYDDTLNSKKRITENLPKLLNIFGEYIQIHEETEKFKSLGYFNIFIGSMWAELEPRFGVDPYDKPRIESLQRTFGVTAIGRKPNIMRNSVCKPENEGFIKKLMKTRIGTITVELNELKYNSDNLYSLRLKQQIKILQDNLSRINNLPDNAEECLPTTVPTTELPKIFSDCVDCEIMKNLVDLVSIMVNGDDKQVLDAIMADTCTRSGKLDSKKKEEVLQTLKSLIDKYGLAKDDANENSDENGEENGDENGEENSNNSESLRELWDEIRALASENKIDIEDVDDPQKANILQGISIILDKIDAYKKRSYRLLVARLQEKLKGKEGEYAAEIQNLSVVCRVSMDDCANSLGNLYEKILAKKGTGDTKLDTMIQEKDKTITKLQGDIAELKLKLALSLSGSKPGRDLEAQLAAVTARLRAAEQARELAAEAADLERASIERARALAERERAAAIADRDRAAVVLSNAETRHRTTLEDQLALANRRLDEANERFREVNNQLTAISIEGATNLARLNERLRAAEQERDRVLASAEAAREEREHALEATQEESDDALAERDRIAADLPLSEGRARTILKEQLDIANRRLEEANARILAIMADTGSRDTIARLEEELRKCREENDDLYDRNLKFFEENSRLKTKLNEFNERILRLTRELASLASVAASRGATGSSGTTDTNNISIDGSLNNSSSNEEGEGATVLLDYINILLDYAIMPIDKNLFLPEGSNTDILSIFDFNRPRDEKREYTDLGVLLKEIFYGKNPKYSDIFQNYGIDSISEEIELTVVTSYLKDILNSREQGESPYVNVEEDNRESVTDFFANKNDIFFMTGILLKDGKMFIKRCEDIKEFANNGWIVSDQPKTEPKTNFMPLRFLIIRFIQLWKKFNPSRNGLGQNPYIEGLTTNKAVGTDPSIERTNTGVGTENLVTGRNTGVGNRGFDRSKSSINLLCANDFNVLLSADKGKKMTDRAESIIVTAKIYGKRPENPRYEWKRDGEIIPDTTDKVMLTTSEPTENIQVVCTVKYMIGSTPCDKPSQSLLLYLKKGRDESPTRILSQGSRPSQIPLHPPFYSPGKFEIPSLKNTEKLLVGESYQYEPIDTHARTIINIIIMLSSGHGYIPDSLKKNLEKHGKSGIIDKNSPIYKIFIKQHRTQWDIISKYKGDKGDTTISLIHILEEESPITITDEQIEIDKIKTNPRDEKSIPYKYKQLFNRIFDAFNKKYGSRACRIHLKFLYDLIVGYSLTYGHDSTTEVAISYYYNNIFKYYIGKEAIECFKLQGLNTEDKVIASLISYANDEDIPFLKRGGGDDDELIDYGDEQLIDLDIDDE